MLRCDLLDRKARRDTLAVDEYLREATAHAAHLRRTGPSWASPRCHAGQPSHYVAEIAVAILLDVFPGNDDLRGGRIASILVGVALTGDLDLLNGLIGCTRSPCCGARWCVRFLCVALWRVDLGSVALGRLGGRRLLRLDGGCARKKSRTNSGAQRKAANRMVFVHRSLGRIAMAGGALGYVTTVSEKLPEFYRHSRHET